jgi:hypothetical protein
LILDFEFDQHLESHKHVINIIMWFRDMGCYSNQHGVSCNQSSLPPQAPKEDILCAPNR